MRCAVVDARLQNDGMVLSAEERSLPDNLSSLVDRDWVNGCEARSRENLRAQVNHGAVVPGKSVTELEILHGVLNNPDMAERSFFYFRDPA